MKNNRSNKNIEKKDSNTFMRFLKNIWENIKEFGTKIGHFFKKTWNAIFQKDKIADEKTIKTAAQQQKNAAPLDGQTQIFDTSLLPEKGPAGSEKATALQKGQKKKKGKSTNVFVPRKKGHSFVLGTIVSTAKVIGLALILVIAAGIGAVFGVANAYLGTTPELDLNAIDTNILTSFVYDTNGEEITTLASTENREYVTLDEIPLSLQQAVVAVEDIRFYHHSGVDLKGLMGALLSNFSSERTSGGSTITQQLVKNKLLTNEKSYKRKIQEAKLALDLEKIYTKDQILEAYLNSMPLGGQIYGVQVAAKDYFGKEDLSTLTLRECACLAGITQNPWYYNPRLVYYNQTEDLQKKQTRIEAFEKRIDHVLYRMYVAGYISQEEYDYALQDTLRIEEKSYSAVVYPMPHAVEAAISDVVQHMIKQEGLENTLTNRAAMENKLRTGGYHIYTTIDPEIQNIVQDTISTFTGYPRTRNSAHSEIIENVNGVETSIPQPQVASVVIENGTGKIRAVVGSRDVPTIKKSFNRATQSAISIGSSMKPLGTYGPAFDLGYGSGTAVANIAAPIPGWQSASGYPSRSAGTATGPISIKGAIVSSYNIAAAQTIMRCVGNTDISYQYLLKLGADPNVFKNTPAALSLGASGLSPMVAAAGYTCFANEGMYIEPLLFTEVIDSFGNTLLSADGDAEKGIEGIRERYQLYKPSTAFMIIDALTEAVRSGTGRRARLSGFTTAGKTGTTQENRGVFFAGLTGHYTSTVWVGHDANERLQDGIAASSGAAPVWKLYMQKIHEAKGLEDKPILEGSADDYGVTTGGVCAFSGKGVGSNCAKTTSGYFPKEGAQINGTCDVCVSAEVCSVSGALFGVYCPEDCRETRSGVIVTEDSPYVTLSDETIAGYIGAPVVGRGSAAPDTSEGATGSDTTCPFHTREWYDAEVAKDNARAAAGPILSNAKTYLQSQNAVLDAGQKTRLSNAINHLEGEMVSATATGDSITQSANNLQAILNDIKGEVAARPSPSPSPTPTVSPTPSPSITDDDENP
ncbi:MAG: transglycosylase domain-containing protein [Christensenellaceae bacterium]|jgi:penicillin-binding protein 1A